MLIKIGCHFREKFVCGLQNSTHPHPRIFLIYNRFAYIIINSQHPKRFTSHKSETYPKIRKSFYLFVCKYFKLPIITDYTINKGVLKYNLLILCQIISYFCLFFLPSFCKDFYNK